MNEFKKNAYRKKSGNKAIWTTREGEEIPYEDIEDDHLINIIGFLIRISTMLAKNLEEPVKISPVCMALREEAEFRGLDWRRLMKNHLTPAEKYMELFL